MEQQKPIRTEEEIDIAVRAIRQEHLRTMCENFYFKRKENDKSIIGHEFQNLDIAAIRTALETQNLLMAELINVLKSKNKIILK